MPWDDALPHAGFSDAEPWLPIPESHLALSVARQEADPRSVLRFTRNFLRWRTRYPQLVEGDIAFVATEPGVFAFRRASEERTVLVALNLDDRERRVELPPGDWEPLTGHGLGDGRVEGGTVTLPAYGGWFAAAQPPSAL